MVRKGKGRGVIWVHYERSLDEFSRWVFVFCSPLHCPIIANMYFIRLPTLRPAAKISVEKKNPVMWYAVAIIFGVRNHCAMLNRLASDIRA